MSLKIISSGHGLLEGPVYSPSAGLLVADATKGGVWRIDPEGGPSCVVPHRTGIGGVALHAEQGVVVTGRNVAFKPVAEPGDEPSDETRVLLDKSQDPDVVGFNDLTVGAAGEIYIGYLAYSPTRQSVPRAGGLYLIRLDGTVERVAQDLYVPNGLVCSPDGQKLYIADSLRRTVFEYAVTPDGGLSDRRVFAVVPGGVPDGLALASDGSLWVALAHEGVVAVYDSEGELVTSISLPVKLVTSLSFGGDGRDLYVVTGPEHHDDDGQGGCVFTMRTDVDGILANPSTVRLPDAPSEAPAQRAPARSQTGRARPAGGHTAQPEEKCPRCGGPLRISGPHDIGMLSRAAELLICTRCGEDETSAEAVAPVSEWPVERPIG